MENLLSCNLVSYGPFQEIALAHIASLGIQYLELRAPAPADVPALQQRLGEHGLRVASVQAPCPLAQPDVAETFGPVCETANLLGAKVVFVSAKAGEVPLGDVYARLRAIGDRAVAAGVRIAMETHPDLCDNGDKMVETMQALDHPGLGVNFDCANIYYYNEGRDAVTEVAKAAPHIVSVHLKDTGGGFKAWDFPTLGLGVVDFPQVFATLNARGFHGPFTLELEGIKDENLDQDGKARRVAESAAYLRAKGLVP